MPASRPLHQYCGQDRGIQHRVRRGVHLACAAPAVDWGVSLTHFYLAEDIAREPLAISDGEVALPAGPGLGIDVDEAQVERFRQSTSALSG